MLSILSPFAYRRSASAKDSVAFAKESGAMWSSSASRAASIRALAAAISFSTL